MFNNQNSQSSNSNGSNPDQNASDFSVRTMKSDLAKLSGNPESGKRSNDVEPKEKEPSGSIFEKVSSPTADSPFLNVNYSAPKMDVQPEKRISDGYGSETNPQQMNEPAPSPAQTPEKETAPQPIATPFANMLPEKEEAAISFAEKNIPTDEKHPFLAEEHLTGDQQPKSRLSWKTVIIVSISAFVVVSLIVGGYLLWMTRETNEEISIPDMTVPAPQPVPTPEPTPEPTPSVPEPKENQSKSITINPEKDNSKSIQDLFSATANQIKSENSSEPTKYIVDDQNNNPVSFAIFSMVSGIKLPADIMSKFDESFSIYFFNDDGNARMGLVVDLDIEKGTGISEALKSNEKTLVANLQPLLMDSKIEFKNKPFSDGTHKTYAIRYVNLNAANNLSIDYTNRQDQLIIGTSKNSIRAILDALDTSTEPQQ